MSVGNNILCQCTMIWDINCNFKYYSCGMLSILWPLYIDFEAK